MTIPQIVFQSIPKALALFKAGCIAVLISSFLNCAAAKAEVVRQFNADVRLNSDCSLDVTESIIMDFENSQRHGIYRIIPIQYQRYGGNYTVDFKLLDVTDKWKNPLHYTENHFGSDVTIKIGEADKLLTGMHTYNIHYVVRRAINFFSDKPEVYWNATGNEWPFDIETANVHFYPPQGININDIKTACYAGSLGSRMPGKILKYNDYIEFQAANLNAGSGLTIVAQLPAGCVIKPTIWQEILWFLIDWWPLILLPALTCLYLFPIIFQRTHNPDGDQAIPVEWNPPKNLSPAEVGTLVDESCDMQDIVSTLVDLAVRGYLQIKEIASSTFLFFSNRDYEFKRQNLQKKDDVLLPFEQKFLDSIFEGGITSVKLSELRNAFYIHLPTIRDQIYQSLTDKKLFYEHPDNVRTNYRGGAFIVFVIGLTIICFPAFPYHLSISVGLILSAVIAYTCAYFMPARTKTGWKELDQCLGFQRFVRMAEKDRIAKLAKDDPTIFGRLLPYAMVLGAADQWAEAFHTLLSEPPSWYIPYGYGTPNYTFSSRGFVHDLGYGMNTMGNTFSSVPPISSAGSGGSGFSGGGSGGGFGGGGGGSW